jgi:hypothetical protein
VNASQDETIAGDLSCLHCGYNLRGLTGTGRCPECGKPVLDTLSGTTLHRAAPATLFRLRRGLYFLLAASALALVAALCSSDRVLPVQSLGGGSARAWLLDIAIDNCNRAGVLVLSAISLCFYTIGIFAISSPLGLYPARTQRRGLELALSVGGIVPLPLFVVGLIQFELMQFIAWTVLAIGDLCQSFVGSNSPVHPGSCGWHRAFASRSISPQLDCLSFFPWPGPSPD